MSDKNLQSEAENKQSTNSRRSALKKIGIATPALITLSSRPAYGAGFCSLSGFASINASGVLRHQNQSCGGYSQGGWKTPYGNGDGNWETEGVGVKPNPSSETHSTVAQLEEALKRYEDDVNSCRVSTATTGNPEYRFCPNIIENRETFKTTLFSEVFTRLPVCNSGDWPSSGDYFGYEVSLHDAILYGNEVTREAVAAYLNAKSTTRVDFHFTASQVQDLFNQGYTTVGGQVFPSTGTLTDADFIALFKGAQH